MEHSELDDSLMESPSQGDCTFCKWEHGSLRLLQESDRTWVPLIVCQRCFEEAKNNKPHRLISE